MDQLVLFLLFAATLFVAWNGRRRVAIGLFFLTIALFIADYLHHATDPLTLSF
ncbi:DUF5993 family protein [Microvirga antarctica]|uniref:DUF5993 family protein n=1 Tax=Microvirga antarctica TaxID=2819233 RepID=UPI001B311B3C|nr:DUF5993 family protein [Microvirga antarctica]